MGTVQKSIRLPEEAIKEIEALALSTGKDFSGLAKELLVEAVKMRRSPGIIFSDGPSGRRARIAGTGIDVWELIATFKASGESYEELKKAYHWLGEQQIRAALSYYTLYPAEIDEKITRNEEATQEVIIKRFPFLANPAERK
jgi:uncharacterized protein (DUF433 family)